MQAQENNTFKKVTLEDVQKYFDIPGFRDNQQEIMENIISGNNVMAILPTGGGKSICYQYPALVLDGITIVVTPLIALMEDQVLNLERRGIKAVYLNSQVTKKEQERIIQDSIAGKYKLLYVSPERLMSPKFMRCALRMNISFLVIDEAHCISMWGYDFRPSYLDILRFIKILDKPPTVAAFTASASTNVQEDIKWLLDIKKPFEVEGKYERKNLHLSIKVRKEDRGKYNTLYKYLREHEEEQGIIYCATVGKVKSVYENIKKRQDVAIYYAGLPAEEKTRNYEKFKSGECKLIVATNAFGMGIDIDHVRFVIHFDIAKDLESYYQEMGRAGRDGKSAECILYYCADDWKVFIAFAQRQAERMRFEKSQVDFLLKLGKKRLWSMINYAKKGEGASSEILQKYIEDYFKEIAPKKGQNHSENAPEPERKDKKVQSGKFQMDKPNYVNVLYTNETKIAGLIRKGEYDVGVYHSVDIGRKGAKHRKVSFKLDQQLTYFDLMVADAVYTLQAWKREKIYPKNILERLAGDKEARLKSEKKTNEQKDIRIQIVESLERMRTTTIYIDRSQSMDGGFALDEDNGIHKLEGDFLPLEKSGKSGYVLTAIPPLYKYAELNNGQLFVIPDSMLYVNIAGEKKMPNSVENLMLRHFIARRRCMASPRKRQDAEGKVKWVRRPSRRIRFEQDRYGRKNMFDILKIEKLDNRALWNRKRENIYSKIKEILDYYQEKRFIDRYHFTDDNGKPIESSGKTVKEIKGKMPKGQEIMGVELLFFPKAEK